MIEIPNDIESRSARKFFLVGKLMTNRPYNMEALIGTMKSLWTPKWATASVPRVSAVVLEGGHRVLFSFTHEEDRDYVLHGAPWHFDRIIFAVAETDGKEDPSQVPLNLQLFWIRARGIPPLFMEKETAVRIGNAVGRYVRMEEPEDGIFLGTSLTVRVRVDIDKPLLRMAAVRPQGESKVHYFDIDYFRLPRFCFYCGMLSHLSPHCELHNRGLTMRKQYDEL